MSFLLAETQSSALLSVARVALNTQEHRALGRRHTLLHTFTGSFYEPPFVAHMRENTLSGSSEECVHYLDVYLSRLSWTEQFATSVASLVYRPVTRHLDLWQGQPEVKRSHVDNCVALFLSEGARFHTSYTNIL